MNAQIEEHESPSPNKQAFPKYRTFDKSFKVIIIGDPFCGKTSLLMRLGEGKRNETYDSTVGVDCRSRTFAYGNEHDEDGQQRIRLQIWDTAGQERYRTLTTSYYRDTHCCILVFDITNPDSFYHLYQWID